LKKENGWVFPDGTSPDWPVIVLQSRAREAVKKGKTQFYFVTDGIESAIKKAQEIAGEKYVALYGASSVQQALKAGLLDEFHMNIANVLLGEAFASSITSALSLSNWNAYALLRHQEQPISRSE